MAIRRFQKSPELQVTYSTFMIRLSFICFVLCSCAPGLLYTDIIRPECTDMRGTTLGTKSARGGAYKVEIPTNRIDLTAEWNSKAIGDIAKKNGLTKVYGCDQRTLSILAGIFRKEEIIVYGE
ncbi:MAG TPA: TRL domain-containing protein [Oligoflexia bacterium]|nr:TRL domain-containing protein [Oligoflexia bacterium]HMP49656.1 TRL domain-containing protein [Oligoflexia bacterium]